MNNEIKMSVSSMTRKRLDKELSNRHQCSTDVQSCLRQDALDKKAVYVLFQDGDMVRKMGMESVAEELEKNLEVKG